MPDYKAIQKKWQARWEEAKIFKAIENPKKQKRYVCEFFPYPSGYGMHMGHVRNYAIGDSYARFKRMNGFNVLYPMGYDAFGLPAENAAIKNKTHPKTYTEKAISMIKKQQKELGLSYDWDRLIATCYPEYYRWNQYFFLKFFEKGLAYRKEAPINWCPGCKTVLANEQVEQGKCWRCHSDVEIKPLEQWFFKITNYADELLNCIPELDWPGKIKVMQENWIGRSEGTLVNFELLDPENDCKDSEFVFFHAYKDDSNSVFWPWLRKEIESRGGKVVFAPDFPKPDEPNIEEWANFALKKYNFNEKTVLVTHSLGGVLALKLLPKLKTKIKKLIMVATPSMMKLLDGKKRPALENCCDWKFDFEAVKEKADEIIVLADEKDHLVRIEQGKEIANKLSAKFIMTIGQVPHFNSVIEPAVLNACLNKEIIPIFTTRPDTLFGVTFMVFAPEHPKVLELVKGTEYEHDVHEFINKVVVEEKFSRTAEDKEKEGMFIGKYAINPVNGDEIPIYIANFVLLEYGTGAIMAVPAHDQRDFEFAKKYKIPIKVVISPDYNLDPEKMSRAYIDEGVLINSGDFNGTNNLDAIEDITKYLEEKKWGKKTVHYKLRDWLISRQRYWGTPIPIIYCDKCGIVPVHENELPILLPEDVEFTGEGNPLLKSEKFLNAKCPKCGGNARRETDTMDTFVDSCWYFLRYCSPKSTKEPFEKEAVKYWMPVDQYVGGAEHAVMHLLYARFFTKVLRDLGFVDFDEPFLKLFNQGTVVKDGAKMSKSFGNVVSQDEIAEKYGIDTARFFLLFIASPDKELEWNDKSIEGAFRFINKFYSLYEEKTEPINNNKDLHMLSKINKTIKEITNQIEEFKHNSALILLMDLASYFQKNRIQTDKKIQREILEKMAIVASPFIPHVAEECWEMLGNKGFVSTQKWPEYDVAKIDASLEFVEESIERTISDVRDIIKLTKIEKPKKITLIVSEKWKYDLMRKLKDSLENTRNSGEIIKELMQSDLRKYGQEITKIVPRLVADPSKIALFVLDQESEIRNLNEAKETIAKEFGCEVLIVCAEESKEAKAKNAAPAKPAILIG